jgi:glutamate:GABA antiporter
MNELEGEYTPTPMQHALGAPLPSEQRTGHLLPRVLSPVDMLALFITSVLFIPTVSIVEATQREGMATYLYWVLGAVTFLLPGVIVTGQLTRFMPVDGAIYVWTHRALGPRWGFFAGFCAWVAGILALLSTIVAVPVMVQGIGREWLGASPDWLTAPGPQCLFVVGVLLLAGWLATWPLRLIIRIARIVILLYLLGIAVVGLGGIVWLLGGHPPQPALTTSHHGVGMQSIVLFGVIVLALLGVEVPLNMTAETTQPYASRLFLRWGPPLVLLAYLLGTFGVQAVVPEQTAGIPYSTLIAVQMVFGIPAAVIVGSLFVCFFVRCALSRGLCAPAVCGWTRSAASRGPGQTQPLRSAVPCHHHPNAHRSYHRCVHLLTRTSRFHYEHARFLFVYLYCLPGHDHRHLVPLRAPPFPGSAHTLRSLPHLS